MTKKRRLIIKIVIALLAVLIACTIISKSIYTMLLPKVELYTPQSGSLTAAATAKGEYSYVNSQEIKSSGNWIVKEVKVQNNQDVQKGDTLFTVDVTDDKIATSRLELAVMQFNNQLNPETVDNKSQQDELRTQLDIALMELSLYNSRHPYDNEQKKAQLEQAVLDAKAQVRLSNDMYDYEDLLLQLRGAQNALNNYRRNTQNPDQGQIDELELEVDRCQHQVDVYLASNYQNNALKSRLTIAEEALEAYKETEDINNTVERARLELNIQKLKNQLDGKTKMTQQQKNELKKQLSIAQQELSKQKSSYPVNGVVTAPIDGVITDFTLKSGEKLTADNVYGKLIPVDTTRCVKWQINYDDGISYNVGDEVLIYAMTSKSEKSVQISSSIISKKLDSKTKFWEMEASFTPPEDFVDEIQPNIKLISSSEQYQILLPLSCIVTMDNMQDGINVIETRQGLFSDETVIRQVPVKVLDKNSLYAAIESDEISAYGLQVVQYTSKPISKGAVVRVVN